MAIPVYLQQFKAAGIYRVVFDKSTIAGVDSEILRLVVGYSEQGPFNIPTYVKSVTDFKAIYGDISKKLEKRGVYFHRTAIQALAAGPILALNLKRFDGETVDGATITTDFNPRFEPIDTVKINVEDIFDTGRFWELSAEKLNTLPKMNQYINICTTNTKETSGTYFIRKASGTKVSNYNITVNDWYANDADPMPEYLENFKNSLISDFFAEVYVFKGEFKRDQVLASSTLKNYFDVDEAGDLKLKPFVTNAYGDIVDTLDALYQDETSNALGHYVGCLIPNFKNKKAQYAALDILFNIDNDKHNMMMAFNADLLEDGAVTIDLSGRHNINDTILDALYAADDTARRTNLLGNTNAEIIADTITYENNAAEEATFDKYAFESFLDPDGAAAHKWGDGTARVKIVNGQAEVTVLTNTPEDPEHPFIGKTVYVHATEPTEGAIYELFDAVGNSLHVWVKVAAAGTVTAPVAKNAFHATAKKVEGTLFVADIADADNKTTFTIKQLFGVDNEVITLTVDASLKAKVAETLHATVKGEGTWVANEAEIELGEDGLLYGIGEVITSISRITAGENNAYTAITNVNAAVVDVEVLTVSTQNEANNVYAPSISFVTINAANWNYDDATYKLPAYVNQATNVNDNTLNGIFNVGDCILGEEVDENGNHTNVYVQRIVEENGVRAVVFTGKPLEYGEDVKALVRIDGGINQEIGIMKPQYLEGYVYKNSKPASTSMMDKLNWHNFILSTLTDYRGIRTALLDKANIDYRYVVDTFEAYVEDGLKSVLSYLCKEKQSAFAILNFPSVKTFVKCPYSSFTDANGVFNVKYIVDGCNRKKNSSVKFTLPDEANGASFCAFYTPLKFSDGYLDAIIPSAGLVSNLFMEKYSSRQPYYIIAGPNYGRMIASGLVGPDYTYSPDELQIIEPFGVNCMIYRPGFGTFINANQTAKQTPVSALSKVNVRELVIYIQDEIEKVLQAYQWEFNNPITRNAIKDKADSICARVAANGGIQAYLNVMDESNNTPEIIDNEMAVLSTHIEPGMGCGKMVQELTIYRTGQLAANIVES